MRKAQQDMPPVAMWTAQQCPSGSHERLVLVAGWGKHLVGPLDAVQRAWKVLQSFQQEWKASNPR